MAGFEMDPVFCKALKLLHSTAKDSADQIMHLLEEVVEQKYGGTKSLNFKCSSLLFEEPSKALELPKATRVSRGSSPVQGPGATSEKSSRDSSPPSEPVSSRTSPDLDDGDLALEIFEDDLNCTVCKGMSVGARNRLVECSECHLLYHQECHKPHISENDVNDPRLVWYCSECMKKAQERSQPKTKTSQSEVKEGRDGKEVKEVKEVKEKETKESKEGRESQKESHKKSKGESSSTGDGKKSEPFKRSEKSSHSKSSSSSSGSKSSSSKHSSSSGSSKSSSTGLSYKTPGSPNPKSQALTNIIAADKRLQNMKKKAAAKMQEKRGKHK